MRTDSNLAHDKIGRLEEIGFQLQVADYNEEFEKHCQYLVEFE